MKDQWDHHRGGELLLLYLANELSAADRLAVDQRVAIDAEFRQELESLRATEDMCLAALLGRGRESKSDIQSLASVRRATRMITQWTQQRQVEKVIPAAPLGRNFPWARYGLVAAAAMLLITGVGLWIINASTPSGSSIRAEGPVSQQLSKDDQLAIVAVSMDEWPSDDIGALTLAGKDNTDVVAELSPNTGN